MLIFIKRLVPCLILAFVAIGPVKAEPQQLLGSALQEISDADKLTGEARREALLRAIELLETIRADHPESPVAQQLQNEGIPVFGREPITISGLQQEIIPFIGLLDAIVATLEQVPEDRRRKVTLDVYNMLTERNMWGAAVRISTVLPEDIATQLGAWPDISAMAGQLDKLIALAEQDTDPFERVYRYFQIAEILGRTGHTPSARTLLEKGRAEMEAKANFIARSELRDRQWLDMQIAWAELAVGEGKRALARIGPEHVAAYSGLPRDAALIAAERGDAETAIQAAFLHAGHLWMLEPAKVARTLAMNSGIAAANAFMASVESRPGFEKLRVEAARAEVQFFLAALTARDGNEAEAKADLKASLARQSQRFPRFFMMADFCDVAPPSFKDFALSELSSKLSRRAAESGRAIIRSRARQTIRDAMIACSPLDKARDRVSEIDGAGARALMLARLFVSQ